MKNQVNVQVRVLSWHRSCSVALWTCIGTSVLRPPCGWGNTLSCHSTPQTWDGFRTCSLNWFILVALKSCGALKRWKSPSLNENRCQVVSGFLSYVWAFPLKSLPLLCACVCVWGSRSRRPAGTDGGEWKWWPDSISGYVSSPRTHWPLFSHRAAAHRSSRPRSQPQTTYTHTCSRNPRANRFPEILFFSRQPLAELISGWHLGIMSTTVLILAHFSVGSFPN